MRLLKGRPGRSLVVTLDKMLEDESKVLFGLIKDAKDHCERFYAGSWAEIVRQAAIVGAIGEAKRHHPRDAKVALAQLVRVVIADSPSEGEDPPMEWMIGREYGSAVITVLDQLPEWDE